MLHKDLAEDTTAHLARIGALFDKPQFSDVRVVAADGCGFYCHRAVLAACSKPFERAMLTEGECAPACEHSLRLSSQQNALRSDRDTFIDRYAAHTKCLGGAIEGYLLRNIASSAQVLLHC